MSRNVTKCHEMSRNVTKCHEMSRNVTKCHGGGPKMQRFSFCEHGFWPRKRRGGGLSASKKNFWRGAQRPSRGSARGPTQNAVHWGDFRWVSGPSARRGRFPRRFSRMFLAGFGGVEISKGISENERISGKIDRFSLAPLRRRFLRVLKSAENRPH